MRIGRDVRRVSGDGPDSESRRVDRRPDGAGRQGLGRGLPGRRARQFRRLIESPQFEQATYVEALQKVSADNSKGCRTREGNRGANPMPSPLNRPYLIRASGKKAPTVEAAKRVPDALLAAGVRFTRKIDMAGNIETWTMRFRDATRRDATHADFTTVSPGSNPNCKPQEWSRPAPDKQALRNKVCSMRKKADGGIRL